MHDEQVGVLGRRQRLEVARRLDALLVEPGDVVVDADVSEVDRGRLVLGYEVRELVGDAVEAAGLVRLEHALVDDARQVGVVDAPHHVAFRVAGGEHRLGDHRAGVAGDEQFDVDAGLVGEAAQSVDVACPRPGTSRRRRA